MKKLLLSLASAALGYRPNLNVERADLSGYEPEPARGGKKTRKGKRKAQRTARRRQR